MSELAKTILSAANELSGYIDDANKRLEENMPSDALQSPDYHDHQTCHELAKAAKEVEQQATRMEELKAENEALRMLIINHNNACLSSCNARSEDNKVCDHYTARGRTCCDCPLDWAIDITQEIQLSEGE